MKNSQALDLAAEKIRLGQTADATKILEKLSKRGKPDPFERIRLSEYWTWLGNDRKALIALGPLTGPADWPSLNPDALVVHLRQAYIFGMSGARYIGLDHFAAIKEILEHKHHIDLTNIYPQIHQNLGYLNLIAGNFQEAKQFFNEAVKLYQKEDYQYFFIKLGIVDCELAAGDFISAHEILSNILPNQQKTLLSGIWHQVKGEALQLQGNLNEALEHLKTSIDILKESPNKDFAYALKHYGITLFKLNRKDEALKNLTKAQNILTKPYTTPMAIQEVNFWINTIDPTLLRKEEVISLSSYPNFSLVSFLMGKSHEKFNNHQFPFWMKEQMTEGSSDGILLSKGSIATTTYSKAIDSWANQIVLDLQAGILFTKVGLPTLLERNTTLALRALCSSGTIGVPEYLLFDFIYRSKFSDYEYAKDRLKKVIKKIKSLGFNITRENNTYFFHGYKKPYSLFLPYSHTFKGPLEYLRALYADGFNVTHIEKSLGLSKRKSQRLLKEWNESNA